MRFANGEAEDYYVNMWYREKKFALGSTEPLHEGSTKKLNYVTTGDYERSRFWSEVLLPGSTR